MTSWPRSSALAASLAALLAPVHAVPHDDGPAIDTPRPSWQVVHCGVARGVLYLTYIEQGHAGITRAQPTPAIQRACARAGYALGASAPARTPHAPAAPVRPGVAPSPPARPPSRIEPSFTPQALGSTLSIDGRNDGDTDYRCSINFSWTYDGDALGPRAVTAQATLPGHQVNRVVSISGPYPNIRFVGPPMWNCLASP
ncbi:MAG: hypothetical protein KF891_00445 [Rhizobacter sp.]|nr:hypothetical protein [Rhizobacter sp.]